jgi:hypothetical protein
MPFLLRGWANLSIEKMFDAEQEMSTTGHSDSNAGGGSRTHTLVAQNLIWRPVRQIE